MHCWISRLLQVYVLSAEFKVRFLYLFTKKSVLGNHSLCRYRYISTSCESASISLFVLFIGILMCVWMSGQGDVCVCVCVGMNKHAETMDTNT